MRLRFRAAWRDGSWIAPAFVEIDASGNLVGISSEESGKADEVIEGIAVPGFPNAHSHAFQYAMAGLTERLGADRAQDNFWSWREKMYDLALRVSPDQLEAIATQLYAELLRLGFTDVVEFHYVHHDPKGKPYAERAEMAVRCLRAAKRAGIGITMVPVCYEQGDFGSSALPEQRRFVFRDGESYLELWEAVERAAREEGAGMGMGPHSLRAVSERTLRLLFERSRPEIPFHLHVSEQMREVEACRSHYGCTPIEWLSRNTRLDGRYHLVHATHATSEELLAIAGSGAGVVLCPSTEANLGDGFFALETFSHGGGSYAIGTDSHVGLSPWEELRWLDYGVRLRRGKRNPLCQPGQSSADLLFAATLAAGRRAAGKDPRAFREGECFSAVVIDGEHPLFQGESATWLPTMIFASDAGMILGTFRGTDWIVHRGEHRHRDAIRAGFIDAVRELR